MEKAPNIILIMTDQQRWDCLSAATGGWGRTPTLDRLIAEGVYFEQCYCTAPSCVPSRASFFNMQWAETVGTMKNGDRWTRSWVEQFQSTGYRTYNVGKMHTQPLNAPCGFDQRFIVENKDRFFRPRFYDDWDIHLHQLGIEYPTRLTYSKRDDYDEALGAYEWSLDEALHWDPYVGRNARWLIKEHVQDKPLFMQIGFPGPHPPYDPPKRYLDKIDPDSMPEAIPFEHEKEIPAHYDYRHVMMGSHDAIHWCGEPTKDQIRKLRHHYAANMLMIDDQIAGIIDTLEAVGMLDNSIIVFSSDHGDSLGDHGQIQKWTMHDCITRVPAIFWAPGRLPQGLRIDKLIQQMDLVPMIFELAGVPLADSHDAVNAMRTLDGAAGREYVFAEHGCCNMLKNIDKMTMVRNDEWKLVDYPGCDYGELYDMINDPEETDNLWNNPDYADIQMKLQEQADIFNKKGAIK